MDLSANQPKAQFDSAFLRRLPKADLHMHLEGSLEPETLVALAARNRVDLPWATPDELRAAYVFADLQSFLNLYFEGCRVLRTEADFYEITERYLKKAEHDGIVRAELYIGPQSFTTQGVPLQTVLDPILAAIDEIAPKCGISAGLSVSVHRHRTQDDARNVLHQIRPYRDRLLGIGMGGPELGNPPSKFADFFRECRESGFRTMVHAGEEGPASYVREAVEVLAVDRIDHGNACLGDPALVATLVAQQIPLTLCPLSNLALGVVKRLSDHPVKRMLHVGLNVSVHSDDPPYFGGYVTENLAACVTAGLSETEIIKLVRNGLNASFADSKDKEKWTAELERHYCALE